MVRKVRKTYYFPCSLDYFKITNDNNVTLGKYCGDQLVGKTGVVAGNYAVITFHSDLFWNDSQQNRGFLLFTAAFQEPCK